VSDTVVRVENLVKKYVIIKQGPTLRDAITSSASSLSRKLLNPSGSQSPTQAGRSLGFEGCFFLDAGEVVGIIGRNGQENQHF